MHSRCKQRTYTVKEKQVAVLLVQDVSCEDPGVSSQQRVQLVQAGGEAVGLQGAQNVQDAQEPRAEGVVSWRCGHRHVYEGCSARREVAINGCYHRSDVSGGSTMGCRIHIQSEEWRVGTGTSLPAISKSTRIYIAETS
ncbi:hypothetical protein PI126_g23244, partial [Phytophthora idaei]